MDTDGHRCGRQTNGGKRNKRLNPHFHRRTFRSSRMMEDSHIFRRDQFTGMSPRLRCVPMLLPAPSYSLTIRLLHTQIVVPHAHLLPRRVAAAPRRRKCARRPRRVKPNDTPFGEPPTLATGRRQNILRRGRRSYPAFCDYSA